MSKLNILVPAKIINEPQSKFKAKASFIPDLGPQPDLLYMRSVLVSTGSNKNDDVFLPEEMWRARSSPILKPVDWEHMRECREATSEELQSNPDSPTKDNQIIGVMYNSYATDENGVIINEGETQGSNFDIPENFHIVDEAVVYKGLFPNTAARIEKGASEDRLFVSMEAWFDNYDYLVGNKVVARNEETSFLEKSLRANGGNGSFGSDRVRRVLRNIVFGGKGIVERPANEPSVIQSVTHEPVKGAINKSIANNIIGSLGPEKSEESTKMSEQKNTSTIDVADYKAVNQELAEVRAESKATSAELEKVKAEREALKSSQESVKSALVKGGEVLEGVLPGVGEKLAKADVGELFDIIADAVSVTIAEKDTKLSEIVKAKEEAEAKLSGLEADVRASKRLNKIQAELDLLPIDGDEEASKARLSRAQKIAEDTKSLDDEAFADHLDGLKDLLSVARTDKKMKDKDKDKKDDGDMNKSKSSNGEGITDASILDKVKASANMPAGRDTSGDNVGLDLKKGYANLINTLLNVKEDKEDN